MATKPNPSAPEDAGMRGASRRRREHPWLKAYPQGVDWDVTVQADAARRACSTRRSRPTAPRPCTYFMGKRLSYAEIGALSDRAAKGLRALGVGEGVKVGLFMPNTPTFVIFYYGVLKAGGTVVNFNPLYSLEEIEFQIRDSGTKIMVTLDLALTFDKVEALLQQRRSREGRGGELYLAPAGAEIGRVQAARSGPKLARSAGRRRTGKIVRARRPARQ